MKIYYNYYYPAVVGNNRKPIKVTANTKAEVDGRERLYSYTADTEANALAGLKKILEEMEVAY